MFSNTTNLLMIAAFEKLNTWSAICSMFCLQSFGTLIQFCSSIIMYTRCSTFWMTKWRFGTINMLMRYVIEKKSFMKIEILIPSVNLFLSSFFCFTQWTWKFPDEYLFLNWHQSMFKNNLSSFPFFIASPHLRI